MAARKSNKEPEATNAPEKDVKTAPESDPAKGNNKEKPKEEPKVKVYEFTSENKYLTVASLGVQFVGGKASTTNLGIARELAKISGVSLVDKE